MLNVQKLLIENMKNKSALTENVYNARKQVLAEIKTKYVDIREEITAKLQYKMLTKMLDEREKDIEIYKENKPELAVKTLDEKNYIHELIVEVEKELPKMMAEEEIRSKILQIKSDNPAANIGIIMKAFATDNVDKKLVAKIINSI